jgi:hypothetical protein
MGRDRNRSRPPQEDGEVIIRYAVYPRNGAFVGAVIGKYIRVRGETVDEARASTIELIGITLRNAAFSSHTLRDTNQRLPSAAQYFEIDSNVFARSRGS